MSCPVHDGDDDAGESSGDRRRLDRREFVKSALAIGGTAALGGLEAVAELTPTVRAADDDHEPIDAATRLNRQHAWDAFEKTVGTGNTAQPANSLFLMLDYTGRGEPTPGHRRQVATALRELERHFEWRAEGLLFTIAYSASYFDRFADDPPEGAAPTPADEVAETAGDITPYDPAPDEHDAVLLLTSDNAANVLAAEAALWGDGDLEFEATFEGAFRKPESWPARRVGFAGPAFQGREDEYEETFLDGGDAVPDETPLSMGFIAGFDASIPREEAVTLKRGQRFPGPGIDAADVPTDVPYVGNVGERDPGVFAQGTLKHLSYLEIDLKDWYGEDRDRRRHQMYSPYHDAEETTTNSDKPGSGLTTGERGDSPGTEDLVARADGAVEDEDVVYAEQTPETAESGTDATGGEPTTAHSQKAARARYDLDGDGEVEQPCLRRDWDGIRPAENGYERAAGYHFNVPMRYNESIFTLLDANYSPGFRSLDGRIDHQPDVEEDDPAGLFGERNGIAPYMDATRRANFLVPPVTLRALPYPRAETVVPTVRREEGTYVVEVEVDGLLDESSIRFGRPETVDQARGVVPDEYEIRDGTHVLRFPADTIGVKPGDTVRLFAKRWWTSRPLTAEMTL
ncbi:MAG: hypothetical protein ABEJ05_07355 [Haloglomus sp.]